MTPEERIQEHLWFLYGSKARRLWQDLRTKLDGFRVVHPKTGERRSPSERLSQRDAVLITYGDQIREPGCAPLQTLAEVSDHYLDGYSVPSLAGSSTTATLSINLKLPDPGDPFWVGDQTYYIGMIVDSTDLIAETDEGNNTDAFFSSAC